MSARAEATGRSVAADEAIAVGCAQNLSGAGESGESLVEGRVAHAAARAQFLDGQRSSGVQECGGDAFIDGAGRGRALLGGCVRSRASASPRACRADDVGHRR